MRRVVVVCALLALLTGCGAAEPAVDIAVEVVDESIDVAGDVASYPLEDHDDAPTPPSR